MAITDKLKAIANAIRSKTGKTEMLSLDDMPTEISVINSGFTADEIASSAIAGNIVLSVATIGAYSFYNCKGITSLNVPNVTAVGGYVCYNATGLSNSLDLPVCETVGTYAFYQCTKITSLNAPNVKTLGDYAFACCSGIKTLSMPNLKAIPVGGFAGSSTYKMNIEEIDLPNCTRIGNASLGYLNVARLVLPLATSIGNSSFTNCPNLAFVDLPKCTSILNYGLRNNGKLATLILRSETMCALLNYALNSTAIWNGNGYVYVPRDLIPSYQVATNWKTIYAKNASVFRAIEDYPEITGG